MHHVLVHSVSAALLTTNGMENDSNVKASLFCHNMQTWEFALQSLSKHANWKGKGFCVLLADPAALRTLLAIR